MRNLDKENTSNSSSSIKTKFNIEEILKNNIWNIKKKKQKWSAIRKIDLFLLIFSVYAACFSVFVVVSNPTYTFFYGAFGNVTIAGRILTMFLQTTIVYIVSSIPYLIVHLFLTMTLGENLITRKKEILFFEENKLIYDYKDYLSLLLDSKIRKENLKNTRKYDILFKVEMPKEKIEKITYIDDVQKIKLYGEFKKLLINKKTKEILDELFIDEFTLYNYYKPDLINFLEKENIKVEYLFCSK